MVLRLPGYHHPRARRILQGSWRLNRGTANGDPRFGFTSQQTALLSIPSGAVSIISILAATFLASRFDQRAMFICLFLLLTMLGGALMAFLPDNAQAGKLVRGSYTPSTTNDQY